MHIRYLIITVCASLFIAWGLPSAEPADSEVTTYWVLRSYADPADAFQERDRIESGTGMTIFVVPAVVDDVQRYRLLVKTADTVANRELQELNLSFYDITDIWTIDLTQPVAEVEIFATDIAAAEEEVEELSAEERALLPSETADIIAAYWVLSSHEDAQEAFDERDRVESATGMIVYVIPETLDGERIYRLLVKAADSTANRDLQQSNLELYGVTDITLIDVQGPIEAIEITETAIALTVPPPIVPIEPTPLPETEITTAVEVPSPVVEEQIAEEEIPAPVVEEEIFEEEVVSSEAADIPLRVEEDTTGMTAAVPPPAVEEELITAAADIPAPLLEEISSIDVVAAVPTVEEEIVIVAAEIPIPLLEEIAATESVPATPALTEEIVSVATDIPAPVVAEQVTGSEIVVPVPPVTKELSIAAAQIPSPAVAEEVGGVETVIPAPAVEEEVAIVAAEIPSPPAEEEITTPEVVIPSPEAEVEEPAIVAVEVPTPPVEEEAPSVEDEVPAPAEEEVAVVEVTPEEEVVAPTAEETQVAAAEKAEAGTFVRTALDLFERGDYDEAVVNYSRALELDPENEEIYYNRGMAYKKLRQYNEAIDDYSQAILLNPDYSRAYNNRGATYRKLKEFDRASNDYKKAIEKDPKNARAYYNRSKIFLFQIFPVLVVLLAA